MSAVGSLLEVRDGTQVQIPEATIYLEAGDELILGFRTWQDYEALLARREDKAGLRIRYDARTWKVTKFGEEIDEKVPFTSSHDRIDLDRWRNQWQSFTTTRTSPASQTRVTITEFGTQGQNLPAGWKNFLTQSGSLVGFGGKFGDRKISKCFL
jgi:hypothetical protein